MVLVCISLLMILKMFHLLVVCVSYCKVSQSFAYWKLFFFFILLLSLLLLLLLVVKCSIALGHKSFVRYMCCKYCLWVGGFTFHFLTDFLKTIYFQCFFAHKVLEKAYYN